MQSIGQAIRKLKCKLNHSPDITIPNDTVLEEEFISDAHPHASISLAILGNLHHSWSILSSFNVFVFINRDCSSVYVGIGDVHLLEESVATCMPIFIAAEFAKTGKRQKLVPRVLLSTTKATWPRMRLSCTVSEQSLSILDSLHASFRPVTCWIPSCLSYEDTGMSQTEYISRVSADLVEMTSSELEKVVYARRVTYSMPEPVNPVALLHRVVEETESVDSGKRYVVLFHSQTTFVSVSPEQLCRISVDATVTTEALAGTCPSVSEFSDSSKLVEEHGAVGRYIERLLNAISSSPAKVFSRELVQLRDVTHYRQIFSATTNSTPWDLIQWSLDQLHPTPAVCGFPRILAEKKIHDFEKFPRNCFAGPLGVFHHGGELCVGLRSAEICGSRVHVFAGAGIVTGSEPELEWAEMELKMTQFHRILYSPIMPVVHNTTSFFSSCVVQTLLQLGITQFVVCPGSRSSPLTLAVHRSGAQALVVADERSAGFYAVGSARGGRTCAVIVTSGTAVANLLPAVCEAAESGNRLVLLTADRPSESHGVGEYQTISGQGTLFSRYCGFSKSFTPPEGVALKSVLADVAFGIARGGVTHLNFEFHKSQLIPNQHGSQIWENAMKICQHRLVGTDFGRRFLERRTLIVCGELHSRNEAIALAAFCEENRVPCFADVLSGTPSSEYVIKGVDQLMGAAEFLAWLDSQQFQLVLRVGGALISARLQAWTPSGARIVRIKDDMHSISRHDPQWSAHEYIHADLETVLSTFAANESPKYFPLSGNLVAEAYRTFFNDASISFCEPLIAKIVGQESKAVFLSSSMPCRDFDLCGSPTGPVGCNRGANGIDGVIASALGFCHAHQLDTNLLIGDVATFHDIGSIALVLNIHPGHSEREYINKVKIICVNNAGGAIFSFLPVEKSPGFNPFFDTPHSLNFTNIVNGMKQGSATRVSCEAELRAAIRNSEIQFIECVDLPNHADNVALHKRMGQHVLKLVMSQIE